MKELVEAQGLAILVIDFGVMGQPGFTSDVTRQEAWPRSGATSPATNGRPQDEAMQTMAAGLAIVVRRLHAEGRLDGIMITGGSGGTSIATTAMRALPVGRAHGRGLHAGRRRCERLLQHDEHHLHAVHRRRRRLQPAQPPDLRERGGRDRRHGQDRRPGRRRRQPLVVASMFDNTTAVDHAKGDPGGERLRGPRLPRHGHATGTPRARADVRFATRSCERIRRLEPGWLRSAAGRGARPARSGRCPSNQMRAWRTVRQARRAGAAGGRRPGRSCGLPGWPHPIT